MSGKFSGKRMRARREAMGISRLDLARSLKFFAGPQSLIRYEAGETQPSVETAIKIAEALGVRLEELIDAES